METEGRWPFYLMLRDTNPDMVLAWLEAFADEGPWSIGGNNILRQKADAIVSPANSYGFMDGGIDRAYRNHFGLGLQTRLQRVIEHKWSGLLPVGEAVVVSTNNNWIPQMVAAPTMERPGDVSRTQNAFLATRAALRAVRQYNRWAAEHATHGIHSILFPGMATGIGCMPTDEAARQMRAAVDEALTEGENW
jgi:O-acetyl-ADP-ribose deacetylase (regulator of RNase III)